MKKMFNKMSNTVKTMTCKAHCAMTRARARLSAPSAAPAARATSIPPSRS